MAAEGEESRYTRMRTLGKGSYGKVFLCKDNKDGSLVCAKEITVHSKSEKDDAIAEAQMLSGVEHFNIIRFVGFQREAAHRLVIYMEYADDGDVEEKLLQRRPRKLYLQSSVVCQWLVQLSQALEYLHKRCYMHRDVKTANLFLTKQGFLKLGDFGVAKALDRNAAQVGLRTAVTPVGTPMYISPQICEGKPYTQKSDMWSLGCCAFEMCTLEPAFTAKTMDHLSQKIQRGDYGGAIPDHFCDGLHDLIPQLIMVDPEKRPSITEVLALPLFEDWIPMSPASRKAAGAEPLPYPPLVQPASLASKSTPNILCVRDVESTSEKVVQSLTKEGARTAQPTRKKGHRRNKSDGGEKSRDYPISDWEPLGIAPLPKLKLRGGARVSGPPRALSRGVGRAATPFQGVRRAASDDQLRVPQLGGERRYLRRASDETVGTQPSGQREGIPASNSFADHIAFHQRNSPRSSPFISPALPRRGPKPS